MDAARAAPDPAVAPFDTLQAEAAAAVSHGANALRAVRDRYREAYAEELDRWQELRDELDALERRSLDVRRPELLPDVTAAGPTAGDLAPDPPTTLRAIEDARLRSVRGLVEATGAVLGERQAELGRLELAVRSLETTWLFLERGDTSLIGEAAQPGNATDLQMRIIEAQESERARLAQEVHDGPAQALSNAIFQVEFIERVIGKDPHLAESELHFLRQLLRRELGDVRSFITQLRPPVLDELGLDGAIGAAVEHLRALTGIAITTDITAPSDTLGDTQQTVVLRVVQEALQNVRKHASASTVWVVARAEDRNWVLEVRDDGRGFDAGTVGGRGRRNFGLQFMRERAELIGARLDVRSRSDGGTVVRLAIPMADKESR
ncbi:MAG: sensor histidine kinase [Chloroflexota bacterium]|nr:sensor histidine kinase [Chloroflexota bacterium]